jgi:putative transposase
MWTDITRKQFVREGLRLPSGLKDEECRILESLFPVRSDRGRQPLWSDRRIVEALLYLLRGGLPWRMLPPGLFPPMTTVQHYFCRWRNTGLWASINHTLLMMAREAVRREASPSAGVIDSQSVKTSGSGGPRGFDAGGKITGRKRHIVTDTEGHPVGIAVHPANIQVRDGAPEVLAEIRHSFPWLRHLFANGAYAGETLKTALAGLGEWTIEVVKRPDGAKGFEVLARCWVVERTPAWLNRNRRLAKDFERTIQSATAWLSIAAVQLLVRRLAAPWIEGPSTTYSPHRRDPRGRSPRKRRSPEPPRQIPSAWRPAPGAADRSRSHKRRSAAPPGHLE